MGSHYEAISLSSVDWLQPREEIGEETVPGGQYAGFYTVSMVKAGAVDQWAKLLDKGKVTIELRYDKVRDRFVAPEHVENGLYLAHYETAHRYLSDAHHNFTALTRKYS